MRNGLKAKLCGARCLLTLAAIVSSGIIATQAQAREADAAVYIYLNYNQNWCAVRNVEQFKQLVNSDEASQLEADQAQVWFAGARPVRISEFRMDADGEWSTTATYNLNAAMEVTSVLLITTSGEPPKDHRSRFVLRGGNYQPKPNTALTADVFRRATSFASFPFASLAVRAKSISPGEKVCD